MIQIITVIRTRSLTQLIKVISRVFKNAPRYFDDTAIFTFRVPLLPALSEHLGLNLNNLEYVILLTGSCLNTDRNLWMFLKN